MRYSIIIIIVVFLTSCNNKPKTSRTQDSILVYNRVVHAFSNQKQLDTFLIVIKGKSLTEGTAELTIKDPTGNEIYFDSFPSLYLLNYDIESDASDQDKNDFILERVNQFFKEDNFVIPPIGPSEKFDEDYSDKNIWEEIKADKTAIGFYYLVGEEDGKSIAYSKKKKKAVIYFNCC